MRILGVPLSEIREAGRLDRLVREVRPRPTCLESLVQPMGTGLGWFAAPALLVAALLPPPWAGREWTVPATVLLFVLSTPLWAGGRAASLDMFEALRLPSREALLLSRWTRLLPRVLLTGGIWALFLGWRVHRPDEPAAGAVLAAVVLAPMAILGVGSRWSVLTGHGPVECMARVLLVLGFGVLFLGLAAYLIGRMDHPSSTAFGTLGSLLGLAMLVTSARRGWRTSRRLGFRVAHGARAVLLLAEGVIELAWFPLLGLVATAPRILREAGGGPDLGLLCALPPAVTAAIGTWTFVAAYRGFRVRETGKGPGAWDEEVDVTRPRLRPAKRLRLPKWKPRTPLLAMVANLRKGPLPLLSPLFGFAAVVVASRDGGVGAFLLLLLVLVLPRVVALNPGLRPHLMGMDLRDQHLHNLWALAVFVALPTCFGWLLAASGKEWTPRTEAVGTVLLSALLFRAGFAGWWRCALTGLRLLGYGGVLLVLIGSALPLLKQDADGGLTASGEALCVLLAVLGAAGVAFHLATLREDRLLEEMRRWESEE